VLFEVAHGAAADPRLADAVDADGGEDPRGLAHLFHGFLERQGVDDGREHPHVVGGRAVDVAVFGEGRAADEVAAPDDDGELDAGLPDLGALGGDVLQVVGLEAEAPLVAEPFAADLEQDALELQVGLRFGLLVGHKWAGL
jgi:hypothetical protein